MRLVAQCRPLRLLSGSRDLKEQARFCCASLTRCAWESLATPTESNRSPSAMACRRVSTARLRTPRDRLVRVRPDRGTQARRHRVRPLAHPDPRPRSKPSKACSARHRPGHRLVPPDPRPGVVDGRRTPYKVHTVLHPAERQLRWTNARIGKLVRRAWKPSLSATWGALRGLQTTQVW